jgi:hypothetical protein
LAFSTRVGSRSSSRPASTRSASPPFPAGRQELAQQLAVRGAAFEYPGTRLQGRVDDAADAGFVERDGRRIGRMELDNTGHQHRSAALFRRFKVAPPVQEAAVLALTGTVCKSSRLATRLLTNPCRAWPEARRTHTPADLQTRALLRPLIIAECALSGTPVPSRRWPSRHQNCSAVTGRPNR